MVIILQAQVIQKVHNASGESNLVSLILIYWMVIYPVDSAIQRLMNLGQVKMNLLLNS